MKPVDDLHCMAHDILACWTFGVFGKRILITSGTIPHMVKAAQGGFASLNCLSGSGGCECHTWNILWTNLPAQSEVGDPFLCNYRVVLWCRWLHVKLQQPTTSQKNLAANIVGSGGKRDKLALNLTDLPINRHRGLSSTSLLADFLRQWDLGPGAYFLSENSLSYTS